MQDRKVFWAIVATVILACALISFLLWNGERFEKQVDPTVSEKSLKAQIDITREFVNYWGLEEDKTVMYKSMGTHIVSVGDTFELDDNIELEVIGLTNSSITFKMGAFLTPADHREVLEYSLLEEIKFEESGVTDAGIFYILDVRIVN